jgi:hypothetical protein
MTKRVISTGGYPVEVATLDDIPDVTPPADVTSDQISDASDIGKQILTAADADAIKAILGITS